LTLVSITVCARNAENWVDQCLSSLFSQDHRPLEIIAVNDGSTDSTFERMKTFKEKNETPDINLTIIDSDAKGLSAGRQIGLDCSKGQWVAITDIDCCPESNWISSMISVCNGYPSEDVMAVTGRTVFNKGNTRVSRLRSEEIRRKYIGRSRVTTLANGPCSMFRRDALISIGGFNPYWYHAEDMEVSLRLIEKGGTIIYSPEALVNHVAEEQLSIFLKKRIRDARAHVRIIRKYGLYGGRLPNGTSVKHDFTDDAVRASKYFPLLLLSLVILGIISQSSQNLGIMLALIPIMIVVIHPESRLRILWSISLWVGVSMGIFDSVFRKKGH
tara:strand:- start:272 stop:1258 length:987 start_codon:yes stop_codon:yes gene_type:complete